MNQISDALRASIAKKETALSRRVQLVLIHLPRVLGGMNAGVVSELTRQEVIDRLIRDGILGARHNAKRIAHAKKHNIPLDNWTAREANTIVNRALELAEASGKITLRVNAKAKFEVRLLEPYDEDKASAMSEFENEFDPDELYPIQTNLPQHRAQAWGLIRAHE